MRRSVTGHQDGAFARLVQRLAVGVQGAHGRPGLGLQGQVALRYRLLRRRGRERIDQQPAHPTGAQCFLEFGQKHGLGQGRLAAQAVRPGQRL